MSPVNEEIPEVVIDSRLDRFVTRSRSAVGASDRMPVRVLLWFIVVAGCVTLAPVPFNVIGVAAICLLALDTAIHRR